MADPLYELLAPHLDTDISTGSSFTSPSSSVTNYLSRLTTLSLTTLWSTESQSLAQASNTNLLSLQALSSRSHKSVVAAANALSSLSEYLPALTSSASSLRDGIPKLDEKVLRFSQKYSKSNTENEVLDRRKRAVLLSHNVDRVSDILELPALLATAIASSSSPAGSSGSATGGANYSQALDLFAHIKRLQILHPDSSLIKSVLAKAEEAMKDMTSNLIHSLRGQNIRLAAAIRTIGWLRRVAPELATPGLPLSSSKSLPGSTHAPPLCSTSTTSEGTFGYLFLTCRLDNILNMLEALAPLRDLADQETEQRLQRQKSQTPNPSSDQGGTQRKASMHGHTSFTGQQTERYLKRYIEIFREQSFATISMYKNIFPATASDNPTTNPPITSAPLPNSTQQAHAPMTSSHPTPSHPPCSPPFLTSPTPLSTFPSHLVSLLTSTLQTYLPNLTDQSARDSLLMQVLYAAGSLSRLGADFSLVIATLFEDEDEEEEQEHDNDEDADENISSGTGNADVDEQGRKSQVGVEARVKAGAQPTKSTNNPKHHQHHHHQDASPQDLQEEEQQQQQQQIPDWIRIMTKHRLQSSRLEALSSSSSAGQAQKSRLPLGRRGSSLQEEAVVK